MARSNNSSSDSDVSQVALGHGGVKMKCPWCDYRLMRVDDRWVCHRCGFKGRIGTTDEVL